MATSDLANKVNKFFNFPQLKYIGKAKGGFLSDNFILADNNLKYFLKEYREREGKRLPIISKNEKFFASQNIPIILPIKTIAGKNYFKIDEKYYSLYPFINARVFDPKKDKLTSQMTESIASNLALMHKLSRKYEPHLSRMLIHEWDPKQALSEDARVKFNSYIVKITHAINSKKEKNQF